MTYYEELLSLFVSNPDEAITKSQELICSVTTFNTFSEFYAFHNEHPHVSTCQKEWTNPQMSICCYDCISTPQSCVCLQCFLKGNHKGHNYSISPNSRGNCDCGDLSMWKRPGFCCDHHGVEENTNPESYLTPELRTVLTDVVFKAAFMALQYLNADENAKYKHIIQFISSFLQFGDGFRRLITITIIEKVGAKTIFSFIYDGTSEFNQQLERLFGCLVNDDVFRCSISPVVYEIVIERILPEIFEFKNKKTNYDIWNRFWFHMLMKKPIEYSIINYGWDWVSFTLKFSTLMKKSFAFIGKVSLSYDFPNTINEIAANIPRAYHAQTSEQTQLLFDELFTNVLNTGSNEDKKDNVVVASFSDNYQKEYYYPIYLFDIYYYRLINCFKHKKNLKLDKLIEELDKLIEISPIFCIGRNEVGQSNDNENDKFVSKFLKNSNDQSICINDNYFRSFHNGSSFFYCFPLYESLLHIFTIDNMNRVKVARLLSNEKFQSLRVRLGIVTLKNIISFVCLHQSLTSGNNHSLKFIMKLLLKPTSLSSSIPFYLPLFQLLLGLQCNEENFNDEFSMKEFFAFEMAREIGLFDNFESNDYSDEDIGSIQKQMFFSVLYMAILIVIERNLFNFSSFNFIEEQIILALKSGISKLDELSKSFDNCMDSNFKQIFNDVISKVATINRNSENDTKEPSFFLKKEINWNTITALNQLNIQKVILEKEISKNPNKLLQIPYFEPEESYFFSQPEGYQTSNSEESINEYEIDSTGLNIRLKEFLFTPTILAVVYSTLRNTSEEGIQSATLNDHLAMMILVLVSRFASEIKAKNPSFNESTVIRYDSSLHDLILKLKKNIFNQEDSDATIKNTLDIKSFHAFLNVKICSPNHSPKSFIDILLEKGEIGKNVLSQMSVDISKYGFKNANTDLNRAQINKMRAKKLKDDIISQFQNAASNYNFSDLDQLNESKSLEPIGDVCSICSTAKKDEILFYAVYIYRTKIPFAFDKPPLVIYNPQSEAPIDNDINDLLFDDDEILQIINENYDEKDEENEQSNLENMMELLGGQENHEELGIQMLMLRLYLDSHIRKISVSEEKKVKKQYKQKMLAYKKEVLESEAYKRGISDTERMVTAGKNFVLQFSICQHLVHPECVKEEVFNCPIDRSKRNGFLPSLDGIQKEKIFKDYDVCHEVRPDSLTYEMQESLKKFMNIYSLFFKDSDIFVELIKSISGLISTYEVRLRSLPDCLDSEKTKLLSRNLFLTTWYLYRMCGKPKICLNENISCNIDERLTTFQKFIKHLIECDDIVPAEDNSKYTKKTKESFMKIVLSFLNSTDLTSSSDNLRKEKIIYLFLKRVCLTDYFLLNNVNISNKREFTNIFDWDEILSVSNLSEYFSIKLDCLTNVNGREFEFQPFKFCRMPKDFLHFALNPYNFSVDATKKIILFNIIDYNYLINTHDDFNDEIVDEKEEFEKNQRSIIMPPKNMSHIQTILTTEYSRCVYPSVFLSIGQFSSKVFIVNEKMMGNLKPFYLDRFGCEDIDYKRGMPLFFNEERYDRMIDEILSGDFSFYFNQK